MFSFRACHYVCVCVCVCEHLQLAEWCGAHAQGSQGQRPDTLAAPPAAAPGQRGEGFASAESSMARLEAKLASLQSESESAGLVSRALQSKVDFLEETIGSLKEELSEARGRLLAASADFSRIKKMMLTRLKDKDARLEEAQGREAVLEARVGQLQAKLEEAAVKATPAPPPVDAKQTSTAFLEQLARRLADAAISAASSSLA